MEKRLNQKLEEYVSNFKNDIRETALQLGLNNDEHFKTILQYICDYDTLHFEKDDFKKRKRVKNFVPIYERCIAKRANGEQCTRRRKADCEYCGTHMKDAPFGVISETTAMEQSTTNKVEVWAQDIQGIIYYIDKFHNVYDIADILNNKVNPRIIAKYNKDGEQYNIFDMNGDIL